MKKQKLGSLPKDRGPRANRIMLRKVSQHCFAMAPYVSRLNERLSRQLNASARELGVFADVASKKIDIYPNIYAMHGCLANIKVAVALGTDCGEAVSRLVNEQEVLTMLLKAGVDSLEDSPLRNKAIKRFVANKRQVEITYATAQVNLQVTRQAEAKSASVWEASCSVLKNIIDALNQLESFTTVSPSLARKINRVVKPRQLADFFGEPMRAQKESLKMHTRICLIINNVTEALRGITAMETVENAQTEILSFVTAPKEAVKSVHDPNRSIKDDLDDLSSAICVK